MMMTMLGGCAGDNASGSESTEVESAVRRQDGERFEDVIMLESIGLIEAKSYNALMISAPLNINVTDGNTPNKKIPPEQINCNEKCSFRSGGIW